MHYSWKEMQRNSLPLQLSKDFKISGREDVRINILYQRSTTSWHCCSHCMIWQTRSVCCDTFARNCTRRVSCWLPTLLQQTPRKATSARSVGCSQLSLSFTVRRASSAAAQTVERERARHFTISLRMPSISKSSKPLAFRDVKRLHKIWLSVYSSVSPNNSNQLNLSLDFKVKKSHQILRLSNFTVFEQIFLLWFACTCSLL